MDEKREVHMTWAQRELRILQAIWEAREHGADLTHAARQAVPDLSTDLFYETLEALHGGGFLDAAITRTANGKVVVGMVRRLQPRGLRAAGAWPQEDLGQALLVALDRILDKTTDPAERSRLKKARQYLRDCSASTLGGIPLVLLQQGVFP